MKAVSIGGQTIVGSWGDFPREYGNCFDVKADDGKTYKTSNMYVENLKYLIDNNKISWPIEITSVGTYNAIFTDPRIPTDFIRKEYCESCTPRQYWPLHQQERFEQQIKDGTLTVKEFTLDDGTVIESRSYKQKVSDQPEIMNYKGKPFDKENEKDSGFFYAPWIPILKK